MTLVVEGLPEPVKTDIARDGTNGRRRNFFRNPRWVREFFKRHDPRQRENPTTAKLTHGLRCLPNDAR